MQQHTHTQSQEHCNQRQPLTDSLSNMFSAWHGDLRQQDTGAEQMKQGYFLGTPRQRSPSKEGIYSSICVMPLLSYKKAKGHFKRSAYSLLGMWDSQLTTLRKILKEKGESIYSSFGISKERGASWKELEEVGDLHPATGSGRSYISALEQLACTTPLSTGTYNQASSLS